MVNILRAETSMSQDFYHQKTKEEKERKLGDPSLKRDSNQHSQFFFYSVCETIGTAATPGLLCQPQVRVKMIVEKQMECRLAGGNPSSRRKPAPAPLLPITKSYMTRPRLEPGPPR
jgi:hypothetical protein